QVFLVTGGTQGIGEEVAKTLVANGAAGIIICGRNVARGQQVASILQNSGCESLFVRTELGNADECIALVETCDEKFGRLDGLVNAAGLTERGTIFDTTPETWDRIFAVNTRAPFLLIQAAAKIMIREGRGGAIVNIITMSSHGGQPKLLPYSASKGALATLTKNVAYGLLQERIRVNGLNIGWANTPAEHAVQLAEGQPENWLELAEAEQPFRRLISTQDVANAVLFLISTDSGVMTGSVIDFDQTIIGAYD
ncbi:MAG: SDR family oxidoreductase, partial [Proteobacteria bacterium]|nr:SDR family oxidoreductase [Pseudomonadota bacterium]